VTVLAVVRPDDVNAALLVHVLGAMLLVGTLLVAAAAILAAGRREVAEADARLTRFGLLTLVFGVLPSYVVMRVGAQWVESEIAFPDDFEPAWLDIGYITADAGGVLVLVCVALSALALRRLGGGGSPRLARTVGVICVVLLAAYIVAVWAMSAKPT
jgi:hypothetical protein